MSEVAQHTPTFFELYSQGLASGEAADDFVGAWHDSGDDETRSLAAYLGMTDAEYAVWMITPRALPAILAARQSGQSLRASLIPFVEGLRAAGDPSDALTLRTFGYWFAEAGED